MLIEGKRYTFSELANVIKESTTNNEYKPRIDSKVIKDDTQNNVKAVKDIMDEVGKMNGDKEINVQERHTNPEVEKDLNKTTLDYDFAIEPSKEYKERVKAQVHGFPSAENEKNSKVEEDNESLDFEGNKKFYDANKEKNAEQSEAEENEKKAGLKSRELPEENYKNNTIFKESKQTMKRLHFSHTVFLNEEQMMNKIPEDYKTDGNRFIMKDANGTEFLVECKKYPNIDYVRVDVISRTNKSEINEEMNRMKQLAGYTSSSFNIASTPSKRLDETKKLADMMKHTRQLTESAKAE